MQGKSKDEDAKGKTPLQQNNTPGVVRPAAIRPRPAGFTSTPTKMVSLKDVQNALASKSVTDENQASGKAAPKEATPKAHPAVVKPTAKLATPTSAAKLAGSMTKSAQSSATKIATKPTTPRTAPVSPGLAKAAAPGAKMTPASAKSSRVSLSGKTPTATMTCRVEALDMFEKNAESPAPPASSSGGGSCSVRLCVALATDTAVDQERLTARIIYHGQATKRQRPAWLEEPRARPAQAALKSRAWPSTSLAHPLRWPRLRWQRRRSSFRPPR